MKDIIDKLEQVLSDKAVHRYEKLESDESIVYNIWLKIYSPLTNIIFDNLLVMRLELNTGTNKIINIHIPEVIMCEDETNYRPGIDKYDSEKEFISIKIIK